MAKRRTLTTRQLRKRARNVYSAIADVFARAQAGGKGTKNYQGSTVNKAVRATAFSNEPNVTAYCGSSSGKIKVGRSFLKTSPRLLTPALATEFLHKLKMSPNRTARGQFIAHSVSFYLRMKQPRERKTFKARRHITRATLQRKINALNRILSYLGRTDSYAEKMPLFDETALRLGKYAFRLEKNIGLRHSGLFFLALVDSGMTIKRAEQRIKQIAKTRNKQTPKL